MANQQLASMEMQMQLKQAEITRQVVEANKRLDDRVKALSQSLNGPNAPKGLELIPGLFIDDKFFS